MEENNMEFKGIVNSVKTGTKDTIEIGKLKAKITKEKTDINETYVKIGEYVFNNYQNLEITDETLSGFVNSITEAKARISGYNSEIDQVKMR